MTYHQPADAADAVREFDGANAYGQPIRVRLLPASRADDRPARSLFDRIENPDAPRRRPARSISPVPRKDIDRYVPDDRRDRSPPRRRGGGPRESGRRPGERGERGGPRGGGRGGRKDAEGKPTSGRRPRKTAEELDAEMNDYWKSGEQDQGAEAPKQAEGGPEIDIMVE